jgi:hypothetical protein
MDMRDKIEISLITETFIYDYLLTKITDNQRKEFLISLITSGEFEGTVSSQKNSVHGNILVTIYTKNRRSEELCYELMQNFKDNKKTGK